MRRRSFMGGLAACLAGPLPRPAIARSVSNKTLRFVPYSDIPSFDPYWTTILSVRTHGNLVYDTLYGLDDQLRPQPQMVARHVVANDGLRWTLTLREGLLFHDGTPVLGRDVVASLRRWAVRDGLGQELMAVTEELSAPTDRTIEFRLKRPFGLLPDALAKVSTPQPFIMPARIAEANPNAQISEVIGSGPFRLLPGERIPGAFIAYERFDRYLPREGGEASFTAGPKHAHVDRVEFRIMPDPATAINALRNGEIDWVESVPADLVPLFAADAKVTVSRRDPHGSIGVLQFNHLHPPFDNPAIRHALLGAVDQREFMAAVVGTDPGLWQDGVGYFMPGSPGAAGRGTEIFASPKDPESVRKTLQEAGYRNERIVLLHAANNPTTSPLAEVAADMMRRVGMNVDLQSMDQVLVVQRRSSKAAVAEGGWSALVTQSPALDMSSPAVHGLLRGNGNKAWFGWPTMPKIEALRAAWFEAPDAAARDRLARDMQEQAFEDVPYVPLGLSYDSSARLRSIEGVLPGFPRFWNVRKSG